LPCADADEVDALRFNLGPDLQTTLALNDYFGPQYQQHDVHMRQAQLLRHMLTPTSGLLDSSFYIEAIAHHHGHCCCSKHISSTASWLMASPAP
jgi:hypothetical protein